MQYKGKEITKELLERAYQCKSVQELIKLAEENGIEITADEAEAFLDEYADIELDEETLNQAAGGKSYKEIMDTCIIYDPSVCPDHCEGQTLGAKDRNRIDE